MEFHINQGELILTLAGLYNIERGVPGSVPDWDPVQPHPQGGGRGLFRPPGPPQFLPGLLLGLAERHRGGRGPGGRAVPLWRQAGPGQ